MEWASVTLECPKCQGVLKMTYNPKFEIERNEHCFRCGYFHIVTLIRNKKNTSYSPPEEILRELEQDEYHFFTIEGMEEVDYPLKDGNGHYLINEETHEGYGCYQLVRRDGSSEYSTFTSPITTDVIAEFQELLKFPFYDAGKSYLAAWDHVKKEQVVLIGNPKNISDKSRLSFKHWAEQVKQDR